MELELKVCRTYREEQAARAALVLEVLAVPSDGRCIYVPLLASPFKILSTRFWTSS